MAKYKALVIGWQVVNAGKARKCYHSAKHEVHKGDRVLEVAAGLGMHGYCLECARQMVDAAVKELQQLRGELEAGLQ